jgi:molecular chaperone HtpG
MQRWGREAEVQGAAKRVFELNGTHPAVEALLRIYERGDQDARVEAYARLLYDQAVIAEGSRVKDPAALARRINELLVKDAGG